MRRPSKRTALIILTAVMAAWVVLMVAGFVIGYTVAPHDRVVLGLLGSLAGGFIHMVGCWILYAVLAARHRESRDEVSLWPHPPGSRASWAFLAPGCAFGVAAMIAFYNHAPAVVPLALIAVFIVLGGIAVFRLSKEIPRRRVVERP